jgi:hypothetical protein
VVLQLGSWVCSYQLLTVKTSLVTKCSELAISYEHVDELSGSVKGREFLDQLSNCQLLKKDSALWSYLRIFTQIKCFGCLSVLHS